MSGMIPGASFLLTRESFAAAYPVEWRQVFRRLLSRQWYNVGFCLHLRVGDGCGRFGPEAKDARWCWPWQWTRLYYEARRAAHPSLFA